MECHPINKVVALIDGEHYPPVVKDALAEIGRQGREILGLVFLGGTEKILDDNHLSTYGYPVVFGEKMLESVSSALERWDPDAVLDLSDEPVVGYRERMQLASLILARGTAYHGADFEFRPPSFHEVAQKPSMAIIGTGKRVGKTAVAGYACRELKREGFNPGVVAMGRGGPSSPEVIRGDEIRLDAQYLLEQARLGRHAASDHFEDALMSRIPTVGCRRCGGGLAGAPFTSTVVAGARKANELSIDFEVFEGSGAAMPPVATDTRVTVAGMNQPADYIIGYLGPLRTRLSDLIVLTNCEETVPAAKLDAVIDGIAEIRPDIEVVKTVFRPHPLQDISGQRVFFATTAPPEAEPMLRKHLEENEGAQVVGISHQLSNRPRLRADLDACGTQFDVLLTELKAAAVDVATAIGLDLGKQVVYCDNVPVTDGRPLSDYLIKLAHEARTRFSRKDVG